MINISLGLWIDILGAAMASLYTVYLIYARVNPKSIKARYKKYEEIKGKSAQKLYERFLSPRRLIISIVVALYFTASLIFKTYESKPVETGFLVFISALALLVLVLIYVVAYFKFHQPKKK